MRFDQLDQLDRLIDESSLQCVVDDLVTLCWSRRTGLQEANAHRADILLWEDCGHVLEAAMTFIRESGEQRLEQKNQPVQLI